MSHMLIVGNSIVAFIECMHHVGRYTIVGESNLRALGRSRVHSALATNSSGNVDEATAVKKITQHVVN